MRALWGDKWGSNPRAYTDCEIFENMDVIHERNEILAEEFAEKQKYDIRLKDMPAPQFKLQGEFGEQLLASKPAELKSHSFKNVAIAASIT